MGRGWNAVKCITEVGGTARVVRADCGQKTAMLLPFNVSFETIQMTRLGQRRVLFTVIQYPIKG